MVVLFSWEKEPLVPWKSSCSCQNSFKWKQPKWSRTSVEEVKGGGQVWWLSKSRFCDQCEHYKVKNVLPNFINCLISKLRKSIFWHFILNKPHKQSACTNSYFKCWKAEDSKLNKNQSWKQLQVFYDFINNKYQKNESGGRAELGYKVRKEAETEKWEIWFKIKHLNKKVSIDCKQSFHFVQRKYLKD